MCDAQPNADTYDDVLRTRLWRSGPLIVTGLVVTALALWIKLVSTMGPDELADFEERTFRDTHFPTSTSVDLMIAVTRSPVVSPKFSADSRVIAETWCVRRYRCESRP